MMGDLGVTENYYEYVNITSSDEYEKKNTFDVEWIALAAITSITCCFGFVGNGYIVWLLGFQIKRNSFTTFILNLAIADFGFLASIVLFYIDQITDFLRYKILFLFLLVFSHMMYITSNFLLTAISIDRCVAVLFPIWHRCSRPKHLSSTVCVLLWLSSSLLCGIMGMIKVSVSYPLISFHFLVTAVVCFPLITLSTVVLFIKVCLKSNQKNQGRLLLMILITLLCFLILASPLSVFGVLISFSSSKHDIQLRYWGLYSVLFSCLNSSINPMIYFLVGRKKGARPKKSMKVILQSVFEEGEVTGGDRRAQTPLEELCPSF